MTCNKVTGRELEVASWDKLTSNVAAIPGLATHMLVFVFVCTDWYVYVGTYI